MKIYANPMTVNPFSFDMPISGHDFVACTGDATTTLVVRDRQGAAKADMGLAFTHVPGNSAWSPPTS